ncbi:MAG: T9SS type A sorting domain-containing protein, partial [Bacteroidia bacterium]|nr:T9SS type A sorting domain-containing protein [Bacteroidia bacterium]
VTLGGQPSVQTGAEGVATLHLVRRVTYERGAAARTGYSTATINKLTVDEHGATDPGVVELEKKALELVTVTVKDGTTNVEGATVTLIDSDGTRYEEKTDGNGEAAIQDVPVPTEGTVTVEKDGKVVTVPVEVDADGHINPPVVNIAEANVWPVKVTVVEKGASPEVPIAGATVTVGAQTSAATGADGVATLYLVKGGTYKEVKAVAAGYDDTCVALTVDASGGYKMALVKKAVKGVTVKVNESATVTLVDGAGNPHTATDSEARGEVSLPGVPVTTSGRVTVTAMVGGETRKLEVPVTVDKDGRVNPHDLTLYSVRVKVVDSQSKQPIEGAKVTAGGQTSAAADAEGKVTLYLAKGLTYAGVKAGAAGYIDRSDITLSVYGQWPVVPGEIELVLKPRENVTVSVDANATVTLVDADGKSYTGTETGGSGTVTLPNVPVPTTGTVTVKTTDGKRVEVPVTVGADGTMNPSDLRLYQVNIYVVDKAGQPIEGATVTVGGQTSAATGANGVATLYLVGGVTYTGVKAEAVRYETTTVDELKVTVTTSGSATATPDRIEMLPQEPYLHVFVVDENLQAIEKVSVSVKEEGSKTTDSAGHAAWKLTAGKEYELTLEKEGYITVTAKVRLSELGHDLTVVMQREAKADPKKEDPKGQVTAVESALLAGASLYPNPAREYTTLQGLEYADAVSILTLSGVEVQRVAVPGEREHRLDVSSLAEGIYLVVLETRGGERRTLKLVVRR